MPLTLLRHAIQKPPPGPLALDVGNELSNGLVFALVLNEFGSSFPQDIIGHNPFSLVGSAAWASGTQGPAMNLPAAGNSNLITSNSPSDTPFLGALSIVVRARIDTSANYNAFIDKAVSNGASDSPFDFRTDQATQNLNFVRASGVGFYVWGGATITLAKTQTYAVTTPSNDITATPTFYIDSVKTTGSTVNAGGTGTVTGSGANIEVGRRADGATQLDGQIEYIYIWSRALSDAEIASVTAEPYRFFQVRPIQRWIAVPAAQLPPGLGPTGLPQSVFIDAALM